LLPLLAVAFLPGASGFTGRLVAEHLARHYTGEAGKPPVRAALALRYTALQNL
jgi:short subunit dehydrogenase-like uncharacterized protein